MQRGKGDDSTFCGIFFWQVHFFCICCFQNLSWYFIACLNYKAKWNEAFSRPTLSLNKHVRTTHHGWDPEKDILNLERSPSPALVLPSIKDSFSFPLTFAALPACQQFSGMFSAERLQKGSEKKEIKVTAEIYHKYIYNVISIYQVLLHAENTCASTNWKIGSETMVANVETYVPILSNWTCLQCSFQTQNISKRLVMNVSHTNIKEWNNLTCKKKEK